MSLQKFCQRSVTTVAPQQTVFEACQLLKENNVGCLVVTAGNTLRGIVTDRDITLRVAGEGRDPSTTTVQEIMTPDPAHINVNKTVRDLTSLMHYHQVRRVPIVDETSRVIGVVTLDDLIMLLGEEWADLEQGVLGAWQQAEADLTEVRPPFGWLLSSF
ncbi:MAG: CBS domain-containing protein [Candidatus Binatia bacterium]